MTDQDYKDMTERLIADYEAAGRAKYQTPADAVRALLPGAKFAELNAKVLREAHLRLKFTPIQLQAALEKRRKDMERQEAADRKAQEKADKADKAAAAEETLREEALRKAGESLGGHATDARMAVSMFCSHNKIGLRYDGTCYHAGEEITASKIEAKIILAAEKLGYTIGEGRFMSNATIKLAWAEYLDDGKQARKQLVWERIETCDRRTAEHALGQLRELCHKLFQEPEYAFAVIKKFIWQVKRRMQGLYIEDKHFVVLHGGQKTGKTEFCRELLRPIQEIACEASIEQILDERNFATRSMYAAFPDELARAERSDMNQIKGVVTGESSTSRVLYSHTNQRNRVNLSLIGTCDKPINTIIYDTAGMRRIAEITTKLKSELNLNWKLEVEDLDWANIWRAVDHLTSDPLMSVFKSELEAKQELLRGRDNVESWLEAFEYPALAKPRDVVTNEYAAYYAAELYSMSFRAYEDRFHPGSKETSLTTWGTRMKSMIALGKLPQWSEGKEGTKQVYTYHMGSNVVDISTGKGLAILPKRRA